MVLDETSFNSVPYAVPYEGVLRTQSCKDSQEFSGNHGLLLCFLMKSDIYSVNMKQKLGISSCKSTLDSVSWLPVNA